SSRRRHHRARQLGRGRPLSARAARAGGRGDGAARPDRAGHRCGRVPGRTRPQSPCRDGARARQSRRRWRLRLEAARAANPAHGLRRKPVNATPMMQRLRNATAAGWAVAAVAAIVTDAANAAGSGMPWEAPLQRILESIEGPVAKVVAVVIIIVTGLSLAFGDMGGGLRRLIQIVFGLSIAFAATSFFLSFFSFAGGALIN